MVTKEILEEMFGDNYCRAEEFIREEMKKNLGEYPKSLTKPIGALSLYGSKELMAHAEKLAKYEKEKDVIKVAQKEYERGTSEHFSVLCAYIEEISGINNIVPEKYRSNVKQKAWQDGHSGGYGEYANTLISLVEMFRVK